MAAWRGGGERRENSATRSRGMKGGNEVRLARDIEGGDFTNGEGRGRCLTTKHATCITRISRRRAPREMAGGGEGRKRMRAHARAARRCFPARA